MIIKPLEKPIQINAEQYICDECGLKSYINTEDKPKDKKGEFLHCPFCGSKTKNIRIFEVEIKGIGEY